MGASESKLAYDKPWRDFNWRQKNMLKNRLEKVCLSNPDLTHIKILVAGQIGAGKSSFINSVNSAFQEEIICDAQCNSSQSAGSHSFTKKLEGHRLRSEDVELPFEIYDIKGLEPEALNGLQTDDIIKIINGYVKEGYEFTDNPITSENEFYNEKPSLSDQSFCLVYVIDANTISLSSNNKILSEKLRVIRQKISDEGICQMIVMTKIDEVCPLVKQDLKKVYYSKKIKEKMELCREETGVPMTSIFPVKNYHDETDTNNDVDVLIFKAFDQIVRSANSRLRRSSKK